MKFRNVFSTILAFTMILAGYFWSVAAVRQYRLDAESVNRSDSSRVATTLLQEDQWTSFFVPRNARNIRLMTNAALKDTTPPTLSQSDPRPGWRYSIEYQVLDDERNVLHSKIYHLRSHVRKNIDPVSGKVFDPLVFGKTGLVSTQTRFIQIPLEQKDGELTTSSRTIRIRVVEHDPSIVEVVTRVRTRQQRPHWEDRSTWNRISVRSREQLARYSVFEHSFLSDQEKASLLRWQWVRATPMKDPSIRHLYFIGDVDDQEVTEPPRAIGVTIEPQWRSMLPVPDADGALRIEFRSQDDFGIHDSTGGNRAEPVYLEITWSNDLLEQTRRYDQTMNEPILTIRPPVRGGLLEIRTSAPVSYQAWWTLRDDEIGNQETAHLVGTDGQPMLPGVETEITPIPRQSRVYLADHRSVTWNIAHVDNQPTPFRASTRLGFGAAFASEETRVRNPEGFDSYHWSLAKDLRWQYLNEKDEVTDEGTVSIEPKLSPYDRLWRSSDAHQVSRRTPFYFSVPVDVAKIRFTSEHPFLINAAVRPRDTPWVSRIPEDRQPFERRSQISSKWFSLRPMDHSGLVTANRSFMISTQPRPDSADEDDDQEPPLDLTAMSWNRFEPVTNWIARQLLVPASEDNVVQDTSASSYYYGLEPHTPYTVSRYAFSPEDRFQIIYLVDDSGGGSSSSELVIRQDGRVVDRQRLMSSRGVITPSLAPFEDETILEFQSDARVQLFFAGARIPGTPRYLKRLASVLKDGAIAFDVTKRTTQTETLTMSVYRPQDKAERCKLEVTIRPLANAGSNRNQPPRGPVESLTKMRHVFDMKSHADQHQAILLGTNQLLDVDHRCFLTLGSDLVPGNYRVEVKRLDSSRKGFVLLHQLQPKHVK